MNYRSSSFLHDSTGVFSNLKYLPLSSQLKHVVAKVDEWHFSKNEFFIDFNLFTKTNFPEKKIVWIFNQFLVIKSLICHSWQQGQMEI